MAVTITGQRWKVYAYADESARVLNDGELAVFSGVDNFEAPNVFVIGDGISTVAELVAMRQSRPVYVYDDVDSDIPEAGTQVAVTSAPNTELYIMVITGDGTHTIAELVQNFNLNIQIADAGVVEIDAATYTVQPSDKTLIVTIADAVTITIPESLPIGKELSISRTVASTNAVTVARSGSETIEGATSFITHGAFSASTLDNSEVTLKKKTATAWAFTVPPVVRVSYYNSNAAIVNAATLYSTKVEDTHSAFNPATGIFTAPISGQYLFDCIINATSGHVGVLMVDGVRVCDSNDLGTRLQIFSTVWMNAEEQAYVCDLTGTSGAQPVRGAAHFNVTLVGR